jgi:hypothetical protein
MALQPPPLLLERYGYGPWYEEFQRQHEGQTPERFYGGPTAEPGDWPSLQSALRDKDWSEGFADMYGRPPGEDDWNAWYYSQPGHYVPEFSRSEWRTKKGRWQRRAMRRGRVQEGIEPGRGENRRFWFRTFRQEEGPWIRPMLWKHFKNLSPEAQQELIDAAPTATRTDWGYDALRIPRSGDVPQGYQRPPRPRYQPVYWRT